MIRLAAGASKASIVPNMGGGMAGLWEDERPVLRPWSGNERDGPFALACNLLVPFSNRISQGGFSFEGRPHSVAPNLAGEPYPIHGDGFQRIWAVGPVNDDRAELHLTDGGIGPFRYAARVSYHLQPRKLDIRLAVTNLAETALPFGLGLHPWFPRCTETRLRFTARGFWPETADHLPATLMPVALSDGGPWSEWAPLPPDLINSGFSGWDGVAHIDQGSAGVPVHLTARGLGTALLYSPSSAAGFFCFEPVSHPVDAHNLPGQPGLVRLALGETMTASMTLNWGQGG